MTSPLSCPLLPIRQWQSSRIIATIWTRCARGPGNNYTPYNGDPLGIGVGATDEPTGTMYELVANLTTQVITAQWLDVISAAPAAFAASRVERFAISLGLGRVYGCSPLDFVGFSGTPPDKWQALGGPGLHEAYVTHLLRSRVFPAGTFLFRPATYLFASIALLIVIIFTDRADVPLVGGLIVAAWIYWLTFLPLPVACEVRYSYFSCVAVMFALAAWCLPRLQARRVELRGRSAWATVPAFQTSNRTFYEGRAPVENPPLC
jgi:hypothetical protein